MILFDPDFAGAQFRRACAPAAPRAVHAFVPAGNATLAAPSARKGLKRRGDIGVEFSAPEVIS